MASSLSKSIVESPTVVEEIPITDLPFMKLRLPLLRDNLTDLTDRARARDRTVHLVAKWQILRESLPQIRSQSLSCCEAVEGKGGAVTLRIFDRPKYDNIQESIKQLGDELAACETAIRELNSFAAVDYWDAMDGTRTGLGGTERATKAGLAGHAQQAIARGLRLGKNAEQSLETDQIYQKKKALVDGHVSRAKANLAKLKEKMDRVDAILRSVDC